MTGQHPVTMRLINWFIFWRETSIDDINLMIRLKYDNILIRKLLNYFIIMKQKSGLFYFCLITAILIILSAVFLLNGRDKTDFARAQSEHSAIINEIAWMGNAVSANEEWIELRNVSNNEIDLNGWKLKAADSQPSIDLNGKILAGGYYLMERTNDDSVNGITSDLIYTGALGNSGEKLELYDSDNNIIDSIDASNGWPSGDNGLKKTMERKDDGGWQTSLNPGGTPKAENSAGETISPENICGDGAKSDDEECDDGNNINNDGCSDDCRIESGTPADDGTTQATSTDDVNDGNNNQAPPPVLEKYKLGDVVVNEIVSDPADGEEEWLELFNKTNKIIDLKNWTIEEGSGAKTILSGILEAGGNNKFKIITKPKGNLNNKGDLIILRDNTGSLIDQVAYGYWDDGDADNNAPTVSDPYSLARKYDGYNTFNNANDWEMTSVITKGKSNIIVNPEEEKDFSEEDTSAYDYSDKIIISEIFPNPLGSDSEGEFVELYNNDDREVDLSGWSLGDESKKKFEIKENKIIKAKNYIVFYRPETKTALNNGSDSVKLYQPLKETALQIVTYKKSMEGWSFNYIGADKTGFSRQNAISVLARDDSYAWSEIVTPGKANEIKAINHPPVVDFDFPDEIKAGVPIMFDSSDTVDDDNDSLKFSWDFGDGIKSKLASPEHTYLKEGNYTVVLAVDDGQEKVKKEKIMKVGEPHSSPLLSMERGLSGNAVIINEILPDPEGSDETGEWIEIYNQSEMKINLLDWRIEDSRGESDAYRFKTDKWLDINKYLIVSRPESKLALNNNGDFVRLYDSGNKLIDDIKYDKAAAGQSFARNVNGGWEWTTKLTPGSANKFVAATAAGKTVKASSKSKAVKKAVFNTSLEKIKELEAGDLVKVKGTVAVLPGVFGVQYFYIVGSPGIQVYNYKKDFPALKVGDYIEVSGELSETNGEQRIKTKIAGDIKLVEHRDAPVALPVTCELLDNSLAGRLVSLSGEVADRKGASIYLDDGYEEALAYIKKGSGISVASIKSGQQLAITGIVGLTKNGPRIMPRSPQDIVIKDAASNLDSSGLALGETATGGQYKLAPRNKKTELMKYLLLISAGIIVLLSGMIIKIELKNKKEDKDLPKS